MIDEHPTENMGDDQPGRDGSAKGERIGPYTLLRRLGVGGMGEVWLAEQKQPIQRQVALKVIKQGMDTSQVVARFQAERQALAMMDHPAIAKIYDAGTAPSGRPYFVMEYVQGVPLTSYCDERRLSLRERLELFGAVCDGVQHAHNKAMIHRDLKPSNVLVSEIHGKPQPKIIDFGIAKAVSNSLSEQTMVTQMGQLLGTPEYMSPEQAEISSEDVDTRTDVYALGVILYELLVGALPFDSQTLRSAGFDGIRHMIREVDPPTPSTRLKGQPDPLQEVAQQRKTKLETLVRALRGDLDWIVMKALEKDRNRRYTTANDFAADIRRYLANEPVVARPPDRVYKLRKLVQRNRGTFVTIGVIFVALVVAMTVTLWGLMRATRAERRATQEAFVARTVNNFLNDDLLSAVAPSSQKGRGKDVSMREVLDVASQKIDTSEETKERFATMPAVEAAIQSTLGNTYVRLGEYDAAELHLVRALSIRQEHPGRDRLELADALADLGNLRQYQGRYEEAEESLKKAIDLGSAALGEKDARVSSWMRSLAEVYSRLSKTEEAEQLLLKVLQVQRASLGEEDGRTLTTMNALASLYQELARNGDAEPLLSKVYEIRKRQLGEEDPATLSVLNNLANVYASEGRLKKAIPMYERALQLKKKILGDTHPSTLNTWNNLAEVHEVLGDYEEAESLHRQVLSARSKALGAKHPQTLRSSARLASCLMKLGRLDEAERRVQRTIADFDSTLGATHYLTLEADDILGMVLFQQGRLEESERVLRNTSEVLAKEQADDLYSRALVGAHLGLVLARQDKIDQAQELWKQVADDLPVGEAETTSILRAIVDDFQRWDEQTPGKYEQQSTVWRERLEAAERGGA